MPATPGLQLWENIADLVDPESPSWVRPLHHRAAAHRRDVDDLIARTPADGLVAGTARVNGAPLRDALIPRLHGAGRHKDALRSPEEGPVVPE